ncbi:GNAT family N-acetyltransferase [Cohnella hongkongensis]|uniref:GNAT family N-acetyltransferase n=1 Tax=Cohnella hongkongensis TaxID=178337 RepID=A0ABV9FFM9_9BACL
MANIVDVTAVNVEESGFFCMRSKPKSAGYQRKRSWLQQRFAEGLKVKMVEEDGQPKGFIEYMPIEYAWRAVLGDRYMVIHCLWIVGRGKGKGYGSKLLEACIEDAREQDKSGVAMVSSRGTWLANKELFLKYGFQVVDEAPPAFELLVKKFREGPSPQFPGDWAERAGKYPNGITVLRSDQCPYVDQAVQVIVETARELDVQVKVIELRDCQDARNAPSAFGVFTVMYNGELLTYHPVTKRELLKLLHKE